jgi:hypothetical protein
MIGGVLYLRQGMQVRVGRPLESSEIQVKVTLSGRLCIVFGVDHISTSPLQ